ncbi:hypothetical protein HDE_13128 [Halotydeus destructor]|nr:hypothetical protein HDE_13128 [Halotydeus destructor]
MFKLAVACILFLGALDHCQAKSVVAEGTPTPVPVNDPKVRTLARFVQNQYNLECKDTCAFKLLFVSSASVDKNEYYLSFDLVKTDCVKPAPSLDYCGEDKKFPRHHCKDVTVLVNDFDAYDFEVTSFANCQP